MTKEEKMKFQEICERVAVVESVSHELKKLQESNTLELKEISKKLNNGIFEKIESMWKGFEGFHREKLDLMRKHQEYLEGGERREVPPVKIEQVPSTWSKMHWLQKVGIIGGVIVLLFRPEIQEIAKVIVSQFLGVEF